MTISSADIAHMVPADIAANGTITRMWLNLERR